MWPLSMLCRRPLTQDGFIAALIGPKARRRKSSSASMSSAGVSSRISVPPAVTGSSPELFHDVVGDGVVREDVLHVVGVLKGLNQPEHSPGVILVDLDLDRGQERALG